jgi:hypothetical protein
LAPNIATITILLATQTLNTLSKAEPNHLEIARELVRKFSSQETCLADLKQTALNIATAQAGSKLDKQGLATKATDQDLKGDNRDDSQQYRQGLHQASMGQLFVTNARLGRSLNPEVLE